MRQLFRLVAVAAAAALLAACAPTTTTGGEGVRPGPGAPDVRVDTPALRKVKARIGMEDCPTGTASEVVEKGLPAVTVPCLGGGREVDLSTLRGPLVINLWQAFCQPCRKEMPALESFHQQYGDRVAVLGIDINDVHPDAALALAEDTSATYPSVADPGGDLLGHEAFAVARRGLPAFVFVAQDGTVAGVASGGVESSAEVVELVEEHLGVRL
jgi:thiol-disulfide isomerase/thioredoxin